MASHSLRVSEFCQCHGMRGVQITLISERIADIVPEHSWSRLSPTSWNSPRFYATERGDERARTHIHIHTRASCLGRRPLQWVALDFGCVEGEYEERARAAWQFPCHVSTDLKPRLRLRFSLEPDRYLAMLNQRWISSDSPLSFVESGTILREEFYLFWITECRSERGAKKEMSQTRSNFSHAISRDVLLSPVALTTLARHLLLFFLHLLLLQSLRLPLLFCDKPPSVKHHANTGRAIGAFSCRYRRRCSRENSFHGTLPRERIAKYFARKNITLNIEQFRAFVRPYR